MPAKSRPQTRSALRHIAVHVEEPLHGAFEWVLSERGTDDQWRQLQRADSTQGAYKDAMADGLMALQAMVDDLSLGPRLSQRPSGDNRPGGPEPESAASEAVPAQRRKSAFFGFGPVC